MTGYGKAEKVIGNNKVIIEIRSLNSKQLDVNLKLPQQYRVLEMDIRKLLSSSILRGKTDVIISNESLEGSSNYLFNELAFKTYFNLIAKTAGDVGVDIYTQEIVSAILRLPEVLTNNEELSEAEMKEVLSCCSEALNALNTFRIKEGKVLISDILHRISVIEDKLKSIEPYEQKRMEKIRSSIETELNQLDLRADKNRFEQELIYYLEKLDITEEKVRLAQHCAFFRQTSEKEDIPGRKLGFIAQEIGREINTIGAKSNEANMQKIVVEMKDELEKIKEQLLNIL
jgi:uncharacterized protein (TIGR00255 family)